jgi:hypothetical protein
MARIAYAATSVLLLFLCLGCNSGKGKLVVGENKAQAQASESRSALATADSTRTVGEGLVGDNEFEQAKQAAGGPKPRPAPLPPPVPNPDWDKKIIKIADLYLVVKNFGAFTRRLHQAVKETGGYIAQEEQTQSPGEISNTVTIRVPVAGFDDLLLRLPADSDRLVDKKIASQDVTMEWVDTRSRLETKKEVRDRYLELLRQAHSMKDILAVQNEINEIQEDMDQASGRIAWLGHSAAYSTINLKFYQVLAPGEPVNNNPGFFHQLTDAMRDGWEGFSGFLIGLFRLWPLLLGVGTFVYCFRRFVRVPKAQPVPSRTPDEAAK